MDNDHRTDRIFRFINSTDCRSRGVCNAAVQEGKARFVAQGGTPVGSVVMPSYSGSNRGPQ